MFVFFGTYTFRHRIIGYRPIRCPACGEEALGIQNGGFAVLHVFWIPLVPLMGSFRHWQCSACGQEPVRTERRQARGGLIFFSLFLVLFGAMYLYVPSTDPERPLFRNLALFMAALELVLLATLRRLPTAFAPGLAPTSTEHCALCEGPLHAPEPGAVLQCQDCGAKRLGGE